MRKWSLTNRPLLVCLLLVSSGWISLLPGQPPASRETLQQQIRLTDRLLQETEDKRDKTLVELSVVNKQVSLRRRLLQSLTGELRELETSISEAETIIGALERDMDTIRLGYAQMARLTYQAMEGDYFWLSLLSAGSLTEAYYRAIYFRQFSQYRRDQMRLISQTKDYLAEKRVRLQADLREKARLVEEKEAELSRLAASQAQQKKIFENLRAKVARYQTQLQQQQRQLKGFIRDTEDAVAEASTEPVPELSKDYAREFTRQQGRLPWPVPPQYALIIGGFGLTEDPYGNPVTNDGIYLRTPQGQQVTAVAAGKVTGVRRLPQHGAMVIVEHGDYRTVYADLEDTFVFTGEYVEAGQAIATVRTDPRSSETVLNFLIYKVPDQFLDPQKWLQRK